MTVYCTSCGTRHDDAIEGICTNCGAPLPQIAAAAAPPRVKIANYLIPAILTTLCCCLPIGVAAIIFAVKANTLQGVGDYEGAAEAASKAKLYTWIAFGVGFVVNLIILVLQFAVGMRAGAQ